MYVFIKIILFSSTCDDKSFTSLLIVEAHMLQKLTLINQTGPWHTINESTNLNTTCVKLSQNFVLFLINTVSGEGTLFFRHNSLRIFNVIVYNQLPYLEQQTPIRQLVTVQLSRRKRALKSRTYLR